MRTMMMALMLALLVPMAVSAQQRPRAERGGDATKSPIERLLENAALLELTAEQTRALGEIQAELEAKNAPIVEQMRASFGGAGERKRGEGRQELSQEERAQLQQRREQARTLTAQIRENTLASVERATALLSEAQREQARSLFQERRGRRGPRG